MAIIRGHIMYNRSKGGVMWCMTNNFRVVCWLEWRKKRCRSQSSPCRAQKSILKVGVFLGLFFDVLYGQAMVGRGGSWPANTLFINWKKFRHLMVPFLSFQSGWPHFKRCWPTLFLLSPKAACSCSLVSFIYVKWEWLPALQCSHGSTGLRLHHPLQYDQCKCQHSRDFSMWKQCFIHRLFHAHQSRCHTSKYISQQCDAQQW